MFQNVNEIHTTGLTSDQESVAVSNTALRVFGTSSWTGTTATTNSGRHRLVTLSNLDLSNGVYYAAAASSGGNNAQVTTTTGVYLGPGQVATEIPVAANEDLFVIRAASGGNVYAWEKVF